MCKQVSRLGFILLGRLPAYWAVALYPFVRFTVTGIARNSHPIPSKVSPWRIHAQIHTLFICSLIVNLS